MPVGLAMCRCMGPVQELFLEADKVVPAAVVTQVCLWGLLCALCGLRSHCYVPWL